MGLAPRAQPRSCRQSLSWRIMVHLSVAIGRFVEALVWAILRVAGQVTLVVIGLALAGGAVFGLARWAIKKR